MNFIGKKKHVAPIKDSPQSGVILQHVMFKMFGWRNVLVYVCASAAPLTLMSQQTGTFCHKTWRCNISCHASIPARRQHGFTSVYHNQI